MADDNFRSYRIGDPLPAGGADAPARAPIDDPLAELARLIGQNDPVIDERQGAVPARDLDWAPDERYAEQNESEQDTYDPPYDERYDERRGPRLPDPYPPLPPVLPDRAYAPSGSGQLSAPAPRLNNARGDSRGYAVPAQARYRDDQEPPDDRQLPAFLPRARDTRYQYDEQDHGDADDQYSMDDYEDETPRRRGGLVVIAAVLGLAVLGTAGAFAYRAMFGGSMLPSLPPIIKADDGPIRVMPSTANSQPGGSGQTDANNAGSGDRLVSREETPMNVAPAANAAPSAAPRVVATIPIFPDQTSGPPSGLPANGVPPAVAPVAVPMAPAVNVQPPAPLGTTAQGNSGPLPPVVNPETSITAPPPSGIPGAKKVHTVPIRPDQMGGADTPATPAPPPAAAAQVAPARPVVQHVAKLAPAANPNAPLSIVPTQGGEPVAIPARPAASRPAPTLASAAPATGGAGGYAVQVSSQRSEAEAQTAFRALQAKYPDQLGGHQPLVRRADLGDKGIYYRALVGPFASMDQAAAMCSSLKAAGGTCIVQKD
jgi:SPOR domain